MSPPLMRALRLLTRLERQRLDQQRLELAGLAEAEASVRQQRTALAAAQERERALGWSIPGGGPLLDGYVRGVRQREQSLAARDRQITALRQRTEAALRDGLGRRELLERAAHELAAQEAGAQAARLSARIEEVAVAKADRVGDGWRADQP